MKNNNLHIVIYSELLEYGGGRETWLEYFLEGIIDQECFNEIWVHHLFPRSKIDSLISKIKEVNFNGLDLGYPEKNNTLTNTLKFTWFVVMSLMKYVKNQDVVLFIGTGMESVPMIVFRLLRIRNIVGIIWVRSIITGELMSRKSIVVAKIAQKLENEAFKLSDVVIFNGKDTRQYYDNLYTDMSEKFNTIENAVKFEEFAKLDFPNFNEKPYKIGYIGRFSREKGFDNLINVAKLLNEQNSSIDDIQIQAWGHGDGFKDFPSNITINNFVRRNEIPSVLGLCHGVLFLNKSAKHEAAGLSHSLLEAMAAGRLIIAWDNVAHRQVINESNGILIPEGNIQQLVDVLFRLPQMNKTELVSKCQNARTTAKQFTVKAHIDKFIQVIKNIT